MAFTQIKRACGDWEKVATSKTIRLTENIYGDGPGYMISARKCKKCGGRKVNTCRSCGWPMDTNPSCETCLAMGDPLK